MKLNPYYKWAMYLSAAGAAFAGYLSGVKLFSQTCAFNESCPHFLGYPACYFGFLMFLAMFVTSTYAHFKRKRDRQYLKLILTVSTLGILFAGNFVVDEVQFALSQGFTLYGLGLPTCVYGLVFYVIIFALSLKTLLAKKTP